MTRRPPPRPIRNEQAKQLGWKRPPLDGFVLPKLQQASINTTAIGFVDYRAWEAEEWTSKK